MSLRLTLRLPTELITNSRICVDSGLTQVDGGVSVEGGRGRESDSEGLIFSEELRFSSSALPCRSFVFGREVTGRVDAATLLLETVDAVTAPAPSLLAAAAPVFWRCEPPGPEEWEVNTFCNSEWEVSTFLLRLRRGCGEADSVDEGLCLEGGEETEETAVLSVGGRERASATTLLFP